MSTHPNYNTMNFQSGLECDCNPQTTNILERAITRCVIGLLVCITIGAIITPNIIGIVIVPHYPHITCPFTGASTNDLGTWLTIASIVNMIIYIIIFALVLLRLLGRCKYNENKSWFKIMMYILYMIIVSGLTISGMIEMSITYTGCHIVLYNWIGLYGLSLAVIILPIIVAIGMIITDNYFGELCT